jgi:hypothetical protein
MFELSFRGEHNIVYLCPAVVYPFQEDSLVGFDINKIEFVGNSDDSSRIHETGELDRFPNLCL